MDAGLMDLLYAVGGALIAFGLSYGLALLKKRPDYAEIEKMAQRMVEAAQQMWDKTNEERYDYVFDQLSKWLKTKGWDISPELIEVFVESAVRLLRREEKLVDIDLDNTPEDLD